MTVKIRLATGEFQAALAWPTRLVRGVPPMPSLGGVLLTATEDGNDGAAAVTCSAYDLQVSATSAASAHVIAPGRALLSARLLSAIAKVLPDQGGELELTVDDTEARLTAGRAEFVLPTLPLEDYPTLPPMPLPIGEVEADVWVKAVQRVAVAADLKSTDFGAGILVRVDDGHLTLAATDRYRLAEAVAPWQPALPGSDAPRTLLVPATTLLDATRAITAKGGTVTLAADDTAIGSFGLRCGPQRMTTPVLDLTFPDYENLVRFEPAYRAVLPVEDLADALDRVAVTATTAGGEVVTLRFERDAVHLSAGLQDRDGVARDVVACEFTGSEEQADSFTIHYSIPRLRTALATMHAEFAECVFISATKQGVLRPMHDGEVAEGYRHLVAPIDPRGRAA